jgi:hypothetical protein
LIVDRCDAQEREYNNKGGKDAKQKIVYICWQLLFLHNTYFMTTNFLELRRKVINKVKVKKEKNV